MLLQSTTALFITNGESFFITKRDRYYKVWKLYYKVRQVLQSVTILLQSATGITKCDDYYKVREYSKRLTRNVLACSCEKPASEGRLTSHKGTYVAARKKRCMFLQTSTCLLSTNWGHKLLHVAKIWLPLTVVKRIFVFLKNSIVKALDCLLLVPKSFLTYIRFNRFFWFFTRSYCRRKNHDNLIFYTY